MNALTAIVATRCWVVFIDETGPIGHSYPLSDTSWPSLPLETLLQLAKTAHPGLPVVSVKWAEFPRHYTISDPVLLVSIPGTHELPPAPTRKLKKEPERRPLPLHASAGDVSDRFDWREDAGLRGVVARDRRGESTLVPAPVLVEPGPKCDCGIGHTLASYRALPMLDAKERTEGFTVILDESRRCVCGEALHFTTKRLLGDKR